MDVLPVVPMAVRVVAQLASVERRPVLPLPAVVLAPRPSSAAPDVSAADPEAPAMKGQVRIVPAAAEVSEELEA